MDNLVTLLMLTTSLFNVSFAHDHVKRSIFPWSSEPEVKSTEVVPGYLPPLKVHKYQGVQINPIDGPPIYLPSADSPSSNEAVSVDQFQSARLSPEHNRQLELLNKVVTFLPDEGRLQDYDFTAVLPYVDLISEDDLARLQFAVDASKTKQQSKLLKVIGFLKALKEKKLKPFKAAASLGVGLFNKKKETVSSLLHLGHPPPSTTPTPVFPPETSTFPGLYPGYPGFYPSTLPPYLVPNRPIVPSYPIQSAPPSDDSQELQQVQDQPVQQQQQQPAAPANVNPENRIPSLFVHNHVHAHPKITPASTYLTYPYQLAPTARNGIVDSYPAAAYHYPQPYPLQPFPQQSYPSVPSHQESASGPYQQLPNIRTNLYGDEPVPPKSSNVPAYQIPEKPTSSFQPAYNNAPATQKGKNYPLTPADTYPSHDLAGSASDNVEKMKESFDEISSEGSSLSNGISSISSGSSSSSISSGSSSGGVEPVTRGKEESSISAVENHLKESSPRPKVTKLRPIASKPPVLVFPETPLQSEVKDSEPIKISLPTTSSPSHESSQ